MLSIGEWDQIYPLWQLFHLYNKRACPTKNEPQQGISYLERERAGVRERGAGWQAGIFKVRLGLGVIEGRDRNTDRDTGRKREI